MNLSIKLKNKWADLNLKTKLAVAFLMVVLTGVIVVTVIITYSTKVVFDQYLFQHSNLKATQLSEYLVSYYVRNNKSWDGVQELISHPAFSGRRYRGGTAGNVDRTIVVNDEGIVVADSNFGEAVGQQAPKMKNSTVINLYDGNKKIGKIVIGMNPPMGVKSLEDQFISSVIKGAVIATFIAIVLAVALALKLSKTISVPLVSLTEAAQNLAGKKFKYRLLIPGKDEIGALAGAFNKMADAIERNEQIRNHLIADVAHELRTPITILRGNLESIQAGVMEPSVEVIVSLHDEVLRLSRLINELQEITLAESGRLPLHFKNVDCVGILKKLAYNFKGYASSKNIEINLDIPHNEITVKADEDRLFQVLSNIMNNGIRYTPEGGKITIQLIETPENSVCFTITDNGPGIPEEHRPYIFERFYRGNKSRNRSDGGTGLGLAIAKSLIEAHGGSIKAEFPEGGGTAFNVCLPRKN